jgi:hypothetical protein
MLNKFATNILHWLLTSIASNPLLNNWIHHNNSLPLLSPSQICRVVTSTVHFLPIRSTGHHRLSETQIKMCQAHINIMDYFPSQADHSSVLAGPNTQQVKGAQSNLNKIVVNLKIICGKSQEKNFSIARLEPIILQSQCGSYQVLLSLSPVDLKVSVCNDEQRNQAIGAAILGHNTQTLKGFQCYAYPARVAIAIALALCPPLAQKGTWRCAGVALRLGTQDSPVMECCATDVELLP